jgi:hypothetical protein
MTPTHTAHIYRDFIADSKGITLVHYLQSIDLAREHQQALRAEALHERLVEEALRSHNCGSRRARISSIRTVLHRASTALGFAPFTHSRVA